MIRCRCTRIISWHQECTSSVRSNASTASLLHLLKAEIEAAALDFRLSLSSESLLSSGSSSTKDSNDGSGSNDSSQKSGVVPSLFEEEEESEEEDVDGQEEVDDDDGEFDDEEEEEVFVDEPFDMLPEYGDDDEYGVVGRSVKKRKQKGVFLVPKRQREASKTRKKKHLRSLSIAPNDDEDEFEKWQREVTETEVCDDPLEGMNLGRSRPRKFVLHAFQLKATQKKNRLIFWKKVRKKWRLGVANRVDNAIGGTAAADVLAGICGSLSSEAISSCVTTSFDLVEGYRERKCQKFDSVKRPSTSDDTQNVDEETCSDDSCGETDPADWTDEEKSIFIRAVSSYGKDFAMISRCVRTRSRDQCKVFFSKARKCVGLDLLHPAPGHSGTPVSDDANGGGSDMDDACVIEMGSATCNEKLRYKVDEDLPLPVANSKHDKSTDVERIHLHTDLNKVVDNSVMEMLDRKDSKMVEASVSGSCQESGRPGLTVDVNSQTMNMTEIQKIPVSSVRGQAIVESVSIGHAVEAVTSNSHGNGIGDHLVGSKLFVPENSPSGQSSNKSIAAQHPVNVDKEASVLDYPETPFIESFPHVSDSAAPSSVMATEFIFVKKGNQDRFSSTLDLQDCTNKQGETSAGRDDFLQQIHSQPIDKTEVEQELLIFAFDPG
ncbi:hypothetical protein Tsubulata_048468 [Turnera subulata]|uniref:SANT domain-containing protein n=1 Tax=Turnera subulata TaxID=218843 RepID=A0A9Q0FV93_9ROSI|nr:hypothetical protein Tsubulata_048468 [Turnera subulata]